jgi:uncharacterized protein YeeX (DUF496 family)
MELEIRKMSCVKCPAFGEWQMITECMSCSYSKNIMSKEDEFECIYEEKKRDELLNDIHNYIMDEMEIWVLDEYINKKASLECKIVDDTIFYYIPSDIDFDKELLDYMQELADCTKRKEYRIQLDEDDRILFV